ncbi:hypothetical protein SteCoe_14373 [Stentor coeruleus]|uniref:RING-type domain-containing protein n=1 Tax=Stentor coeruleus TaxID=5963 RepID=A0A1R2C3W0_9CILI|nr:hypothetical protein SteCoe_15323 [Stentor coeruleus]OMJ84488.1 hypothetical protein SteCoe_14373 [Stentor coeruleus]
MLKKIVQIATLSLVLGLLSLFALNSLKNYNSNQSYQDKIPETDLIIIDDNPTEVKLELTRDESYLRRLNECYDYHCKKCYESPSICDECENGYQVKDTVCEKKTSKLNSDEFIIIMAAIFSPMFLIVTCCIFCCVWYRKHKRETDRPRESHESQVPLEVNHLHSIHVMNRFNVNQRPQSESFDSSESTGERDGSEKNVLALLNGKILVNENTFEKAIQIYSRDENDILLADGICSICLDNYDENRQYRITPCGHIFHHDCIYSWLITYKKKKCPNDNFKFK